MITLDSRAIGALRPNIIGQTSRSSANQRAAQWDGATIHTWPAPGVNVPKSAMNMFDALNFTSIGLLKRAIKSVTVPAARSTGGGHNGSV